MSGIARDLVLCSKSRWSPAIRREHAVAELAAQHGVSVTFVESPADVRSLAAMPWRQWFGSLTGSVTASASSAISVVGRTAPAPAHRGVAARLLDNVLLGRVLAPHDHVDAAIVVTTPWMWPAASRLAHARRVFDCADDWAELVPRQRSTVNELVRRIGEEADAVVVGHARLADQFGRREVVVVKNAVDERMLRTPIQPRMQSRTLVYAGTLSERLDVSLLQDVLRRLPEWRLNLFGECRYRRFGNQPSPELRRLLDGFPGRVSWRRAVERDELVTQLDRASVLLLPHRTVGANTGDSMKLYDYAARGRPIVTTRWSDDVAETGPPGIYVADSSQAFVAAIVSSIDEDRGLPARRRAWAEQNRWSARWLPWSTAVFGN